jgi:UDP-2,4-diacetamido-2,4,6-trideoxy-beta-L-altropyranose hydrolase
VTAPRGLRVAYVCQGAGRLGWGHVVRGRSLVEVAGPGSALIVGSGADEVVERSRAWRPAVATGRWHSAKEPLATDDARFDAVVVDDYDVDAEWIRESADRRPTFVVDDWQRTRVSATGLVNPNLGASRSDYPEVTVQDWLLGPGFVLLRGEVRARPRTAEPGGPIGRVLVTLGGSDPGGHTASIVELLVEHPWYQGGGRVTAVLGPSYSGARPWASWPHSRRIRLEVLQDPPDFVTRCATAGLVITASGTTTYELAHLGVGFIPVATVGNQGRIVEAWAGRGVGAGLAVWQPAWRARLQGLLGAVLEAQAGAVTLARAARGIVDGQGATRVLEACACAVQRAAG